MNWQSLLLSPISLAYGAVTGLRNRMFDSGRKPSFQFDVFTVNVGNLAVGGTGKTPHVAWLVDKLSSQFSICTLSRGYRRRTKGFILAGKASGADELGDEPALFRRRFGENVGVAVGERRAEAIPKILLERPDTDLIIMDDAFQHRHVLPHFNILLSRAELPFYQDTLLPAGRLRESPKGADRADAVIFTNCKSDIGKEEMRLLETQARKYLHKNQPVYFSKVTYGELVPVFPEKNYEIPAQTMLFSGLADASAFEAEMHQRTEVLGHRDFPDHHEYTLADISELVAALPEGAGLVTTEKDAMKLLGEEIRAVLEKVPVFYLPISIGFLGEGRGEALLSQLLAHRP